MRWQWWLMLATAAALVAVPATRDMVRMQASGIWPSADHYGLYPLWEDDGTIRDGVSLYSQLSPRGDPTDSPLTRAARRLERLAGERPDDFVVHYGAVSLMPAGDSPSDPTRKARASAARDLAERFPDEELAALLWVDAELACLPDWPDWYRREPDDVYGSSETEQTRLLTVAEAQPAIDALQAGLRRFPDNALWELHLAGMYFRMGRDEDTLQALTAAAEKPYFGLRGGDRRRTNFEAAGAAGLPVTEALNVYTRTQNRLEVVFTARAISALAEKAASAGNAKEAIDYWTAAAKLGGVMRRTGTTLADGIVGILLLGKNTSSVVDVLSDDEAEGREPLPGGERMYSRNGGVWYKGPYYDVFAKEASPETLHAFLNEQDAAQRWSRALVDMRAESASESRQLLESSQLSLHLMVIQTALLALGSALFLLWLLVWVLWRVLRRPQAGLRFGWQAAILVLGFGVAGAAASALAFRGEVVSARPILARAVWLVPVVFVLLLGVVARVLTRKLTAPERGIDRCRVGLLYQVLPNALLLVVVAYVALAVPTAIIRQQYNAAVLPYVYEEDVTDFRRRVGWDEAKLEPPFPVRAGPAEHGRVSN